jgi:hypothetical protein
MGVSNSDSSNFAALPKYISFVDEAGHSKDPHRNYLCLAGLLAEEMAWKQFDADWRTACADEGLTRPFHMMDLAAYKRQFEGWNEEQRRRLLRKLISAIRDARAIPIGSVVSVKDFNDFEPRLKGTLKDPYFMAFQSLTYHIAVAAGMQIPPGRVTMVYAHHPEHSEGLGNAQELWVGLRENNPIIAQFMKSYVCGEPATHPPLQAADLWAYELAHHFEVIRPKRKTPRWPFQQFVEMGLNYSFTHDFITYHDATGVNGLGRMSVMQRHNEISLYEPEPEPDPNQ